LKERAHFALAGLWEEWKDKESGEMLRTFSIVTTEANDLLKRIHNKTGAEGSRMPVILTEEEEDAWLAPVNNAGDEAAIQALIRPYPPEAMDAHPVRTLLGKDGVGNSEGASDAFEYPELILADPLA
jgi:putative SOS response-associated peptidase YedK